MIKLADISTMPPPNLDEEETRKKTKKLAEKLGKLQHKLIASKTHAVLVVFQGMDGSGKDGAVKNVFQDCHIHGINVHSFKKPTEEEMSHDFLWRVHEHAPPKGMIHIFNRSHYEDVLIQRVYKWIDEKRVDKRIEAINAFEELLAFDNNTVILKFYLHLSFEQQALELQERIDDPEKHWKYNAGDWKERERWPDYMRCYEDVINRSRIPWTIVPVDKRWYRDYIVATAMVEALEQLNLEFPPIQED